MVYNICVYATKATETSKLVSHLSRPPGLQIIFNGSHRPHVPERSPGLFYRFVGWPSQPMNSISAPGGIAVPAGLSPSPYLPSDSFFFFVNPTSLFPFITNISKMDPSLVTSSLNISLFLSLYRQLTCSTPAATLAACLQFTPLNGQPLLTS
jgi:hypothetical protein